MSKGIFRFLDNTKFTSLNLSVINLLSYSLLKISSFVLYFMDIECFFLKYKHSIKEDLRGLILY